MRSNTHPIYQDLVVHCSCGNTFFTRSTAPGHLQLDVCADCHPTYTGHAQPIVTPARVEAFYRKYAARRPTL